MYTIDYVGPLTNSAGSQTFFTRAPSTSKIIMCQKTGPQSNNIYIVKSLNKMQNTFNTLQRDIYITWLTQKMGYVHIQISSPFITLQKDEGIQPATLKTSNFMIISIQNLMEIRRMWYQLHDIL